MALRNRLLDKKGQILIESVFLALAVSAVLIIFKQLIEFQKSKQHYRFSKNTKEPAYAAEPSNNHSK